MAKPAGNAQITTAKEWLESVHSKSNDESMADSLWNGGFFDAISLAGLRVASVEQGRAAATFRIPAHLTDADGNWQPGPIATAMDDVGAAAIMSLDGRIPISVEFDISYFSPAKFDEEVEMAARVIERKGRLMAVMVEIRKKGSGELVAVGRQWMTFSRPLKSKI
ncbi:uncharacterized protein [Typha latifolia]|uniref:uncharacterized protein n=1 Tax=Typha latifolia TaxID=4733 RepID=UPI003C2C99B6